ncbi:uncharacterized protein BDW43DRAFT_317269 [Aspergillus alliaceus]|uniref:uncharacterized protein n=1 Tax=Petromyces alliaceus TaxID=209559 RepID=UPI0012A48FF1|nr:uncharacterized protein BDW43DRAFT_317269 [Aspergillus alliaceus]KAB8226969.1 hypothetical protein BDW43DRAFT_317269 [Aspergillus alliaceus]
MESQLFKKLDTIPIIIYHQCMHGVWPQEITRHLKNRVHQMANADTVAIQNTVAQWKGIAINADTVKFPHQLARQIPELSIYPDGLLCQRKYPQYRYITRSIKGIQ